MSKYEATAVEQKHIATDQEAAISDEKQNKLLRLLGGKKTGNIDAASEWVHKSRTDEEEKNLEQGLEAQYNASLDLRLSGKARRHEGIGFHDDPEEGHDKKLLDKEDHKSGQNLDNKSNNRRDRSRSPLRKDDEKCEENKKSKDGEPDSAHIVPNPTSKTITKKSFYMQFTKSQGS